MSRGARFLLFSVILFSAACSNDPATQSKRLVESGNKFFDKGKFKEASMQYRRAIQKAPKNGDAYYRLGLTSVKLGDVSTAAQSFRRALDSDPNNLDAAVKLADIYWLAFASDQQKYKALLPDIQEIVNNTLLKRDPKSYDGLRLSGYMQMANNDLEGALTKFKIANQQKPYQPELSMVLYQTLIATKRPDEAEALARDYLKHDSHFSPMYDQLVLQLLARNDMPGVEKLLQDKVAANPKQENYYLQLAGFYMYQKKQPEMEAALQKVISNPKDFPLAHLSVGRFFYRMRDFDRARREYDAGIKDNPKEKASFQKAIVELLAAQGKNAEARVIVDELLKDNAKDTQAIEMRSSLQLATGNRAEIQSAVNDLQALVTKNPENPIYHFELGRALMASNQAEQARVQLEEAIRLRPDFIPPKLMLAQLVTARADHGKALQLADEILRVEPANINARLVRSSALIGLGERDKAKAELDEVLRVAPNSADARFQLGLVNYSERNYGKADSIFRQMQEANPADNRGLVGVIETQVAQHDFNGAIKILESQIQKDPNRQDFKLALANVLVRAERYDDAVNYFRQLTAANPKSADLFTRLGETYRLKGDINNAMDNFKKANALNPNDVEPMVRLALLMDGMGRRNEAKPVYEQILKIKPDNPVALNNLAYIKAEEGTDLDQALALAQRAKQAMPTDLNIADTLGWVYIKKNLSEDAIRVFNELVQKDPKNATYRYHLAMALFQKGDRGQAKKQLEVAVQSNPSQEDSKAIRELMQKIG